MFTHHTSSSPKYIKYVAVHRLLLENEKKHTCSTYLPRNTAFGRENQYSAKVKEPMKEPLYWPWHKSFCADSSFLTFSESLLHFPIPLHIYQICIDFPLCALFCYSRQDTCLMQGSTFKKHRIIVLTLRESNFDGCALEDWMGWDIAFWWRLWPTMRWIWLESPDRIINECLRWVGKYKWYINTW